MFTPDVVSLRQFYATPLGEEAQRLIARSIEEFWPDATNDAILGIGYSTPYLSPYVRQDAMMAVCMPAQQGAAYWPPSGANRVFLAHESELPLQENSVNRVLLVHSVENSEQLSGMMREIWRVLTPGGRVLAIVPNRLSFWSRSSRSPFGYGRPFSVTQMRDLMSGHNFALTRCTSALFMQPTRMRPFWRIADHLEKLGKLICWFMGGVLLIEAEKQVYAPIHQPVVAKQNYRPIPVPKPAMSRSPS